MAAAAELSGEALRAYQADAGLVADGILGPITRSALLADSLIPHMTDLMSFRGSLGLLIQLEGFRGHPYWPGGQSGVTLDFGFDMGQQTADHFRALYGRLWEPAAVDELAAAAGLRGAAIRAWMRQLTTHEWPITRSEAARILPRAAGPYWHAAVRACPALRTAPPRVQTALLSVTYSAWVGIVQSARTQLERGNWGMVALIVRRSKGAKKRREVEAKLIESVREEA